jgi:hypothetical protein
MTFLFQHFLWQLWLQITHIEIFCPHWINMFYFYLVALFTLIKSSVWVEKQWNIWGFHGGDYEECRLLGCGAVQILYKPTFRRKVPPPSPGQKKKEKKSASEEPAWADGYSHFTLVPRSRIFSSTLKMEAIRSSETSVYTISTRRHIPEDGILQ